MHINSISDQKEPVINKNKKIIGKLLIIAGVALAALALGVIVGCAGSPLSPFKEGETPNSLIYPNTKLWNSMGMDFQNSMGPNFNVCVAMGGGFGSFLLSLGLIATGCNLTGQGPKPFDSDTSKKKRKPIKMHAKDVAKDVAKWAAVIICGFALGMYMATNIISNYKIPHIKDLLAQAREKFPEDNSYWDKVETRWLEPSKELMGNMGNVSQILGIAGGSLLLFISLLSLAQLLAKKFKAEPIIMEGDRGLSEPLAIN